MEFEEFNKAASKCKVYNCISNLYNIYLVIILINFLGV